MNTAFERTEQKDEWLTPPELISALGVFDLDPCAPINRPWPTAKKHYTREDDGIVQPWEGRVWLNPPYGPETKRWVRKLAYHGNGVALIFGRTDTATFHEWVFGKADGILFLRGRIKFCSVDGKTAANGAGAPSVLIAFGQNNAKILEASNLGYYVSLNPVKAYEEQNEP